MNKLSALEDREHRYSGGPDAPDPNENRGGVGTITLDHPKKRNALSRQLVDAIVETLESFSREHIRVVVLRAQPGVKVWSAGHDVDELPEGRRDPLGWDDPLRNLVRSIEEFPTPVIAAIEGGVWGGACEVAFACDLIFVAPTATFAVTPAKLGVPYNVTGMLTFLNACSLRIVKEMAFTAQPISAKRAAKPWHSQSRFAGQGARTLHVFACSARLLRMHRYRSQ